MVGRGRGKRKSMEVDVPIVMVTNPVAASDGTPTLPTTFSTDYGTAPATVKTVGASGCDYTTVQAAITAAASAGGGWTIAVTAGETFTENIELPNWTGSGWIYVISSDLASLPEGVRVGPSDTASMPLIKSTTTMPTISAAFAAHNYRFAGIEIQSTANNTYQTVLTGYNGQTVTPAVSQESDYPTYIWMDRCYIHSVGEINTQQGFSMNGRYIALFDSYVPNYKWEGGSDSNAAAIWNGGGPYKIRNNYLEASHENFISGGADPKITNEIPSDIEFTRNYCVKPTAWKTDVWYIKNLFELKNAQRVLVEGNIFENSWKLSNGYQEGRAWVLTVRNQDNTAPWSTVRDVTMRYNKVLNVGQWMGITGCDDINISAQTQRILIEHNLIDQIDIALEPAYATGVSLASNDATKPIKYLTIKNNTFTITGTEAGGAKKALYFQLGDPIAENFIFRDNIATLGDYAILGGVYTGTACFVNLVDGTYTFSGNGFITRNADSGAMSQGTFDANYSGPTTNVLATEMTAAKFTDYTNHDWTLAGDSPFKGIGSSGADPGPNFALLNAATLHTLTGDWT
jgi:hypothetical protein